MSASPEPPDGAVVVGSISVLLLIKGEGTSTAYSVNDMSNETAVGHLRAVIRQIENEIDDGWDGDVVDIDGFNLTCPECDERIEVDADDVDPLTEEEREGES